MVVDEVELLLLGSLTLEQLAEDSQAEGPMGKGRLASFFQGAARVVIGKAQKPLEHANPCNSAVFEHRFSPTRRVRTNPAHLAQ